MQVYKNIFTLVFKLFRINIESLLLCVQIRIWARRAAIDQGQGDYALSVTGPILNFFQLYYNISYPLSKSGEPVSIVIWKRKCPTQRWLFLVFSSSSSF